MALHSYLSHENAIRREEQRFREAARKSSFLVAPRQGEGGQHVDCETSRQIFGFDDEKFAVAESNMTGRVMQNNSLW